jgi:two-component sensor histidine kinase
VKRSGRQVGSSDFPDKLSQSEAIAGVNSGPVQQDEPHPFAAGAGRMARLVREFDWASTSLGAAADWPAELKSAVGLILESRFPCAVVWGAELVTLYNDAFRPILGDKPEALGRPFSHVWAEVWDEIGPIAARAYAGEATYIEDFPLVVERTGEPEPAWFTFCYSPLRLTCGTVAGMIDTVVETTETVRTRAALQLMNAELGHRMKNTLAMVQAIASQTLKDVEPEVAVRAFTDRLGSLGRAHDVLLRQSWTSTSLGRVAEATLAPLAGSGQIQLDGPEITIGSRASLALSLMLHELATNAAKYGALSAPSGEVALDWTVEDGRLRLRWRESGGPAVREPARQGFGSRLIDMGLGSGCVVTRRWPASGLELEVEVPLRQLAD